MTFWLHVEISRLKEENKQLKIQLQACGSDRVAELEQELRELRGETVETVETVETAETAETVETVETVVVPAASLSRYELEQQANIARNNQMLQRLNLGPLVRPGETTGSQKKRTKTETGEGDGEQTARRVSPRRQAAQVTWSKELNSEFPVASNGEWWW